MLSQYGQLRAASVCDYRPLTLADVPHLPLPHGLQPARPLDMWDEHSIQMVYGEHLHRLTPAIHAALVRRAAQERRGLLFVPGGLGREAARRLPGVFHRDAFRPHAMFVVDAHGVISDQIRVAGAEDFDRLEAMDRRKHAGFVDVRFNDDDEWEPIYVYVGEVGGVNWQ